MKNQKEVWKDVKNYEGLYMVSNLGNIKSLDRLVKSKNKSFRKHIGKKLNPSISCGYYHTILYNNGVGCNVRIHQVVAASFLSHKDSRYIVVDHIDNNSLNNKLDNLQIITQRENSIKDKDKSIFTSKYTGVHKSGNGYVSKICVNGKSKYLGYFSNELAASNRYKKELNSLNKQI